VDTQPETTKRWTLLPGLFRWADVAAQVETAQRSLGCEVRVSFVRTDKKGRGLFQISVAEPEPQRNTA